jgi:hypothetical protein
VRDGTEEPRVVGIERRDAGCRRGLREPKRVDERALESSLVDDVGEDAVATRRERRQHGAHRREVGHRWVQVGEHAGRIDAHEREVNELPVIGHERRLAVLAPERVDDAEREHGHAE